MITALNRKVNKPRVSLRTKKVEMSSTEKSIITTIFWSAGVRTSGIENLTPGMLGFNFGAVYSPKGYTYLSAFSLRKLREYLKKYNVQDWTHERK